MVRFFFTTFLIRQDILVCLLLTWVLFLTGKGRPVLEWARRVRIAIGSAKGLAYLHEDCKYFLQCLCISKFKEKLNQSDFIYVCFCFAGHPKIIHRDIKSANILLDDEFEAQAILFFF